MKSLIRLTLVAGALLSPASLTKPAAAEPESLHRVYSHLLEPREHPDYLRRQVKPPTWETFRHRTQFTSARGFNVQDGLVVGYEAELEKFTRTHRLGDVIWPAYPILFARNLDAFADEIRRRDLYLFDVWGYVPGSGPGGYWQQFRPPATAYEILESKLGERWLGTDIGEQDGRYIGGYANQMTPASATRFEQYLNFQRHFERMGDDLGHKHATLVSLNYGHYFLKEGTYTLIGAETAQGLPNNQVYYAFIRGAGKQYGVPWFGNASIYNRWGYKTYGSSGHSDGYAFGPTKGTSLSLMKRLMYLHLLYNSLVVGFENGWFEGDQLSPIGKIQQGARRWVEEHGQPGVQHTPVALLLDFFAGWTFPRHLYSDKIYRVWGNRPYEAGDFLTDAVLDLLYPGYQDSSYFHDESGFITPTPYGDIADCLLSDAPEWVLDRYPLVVAAGDLAGGLELRAKLEHYVRQGGHLVITTGNLARLPGGLAGVNGEALAGERQVGAGRLTVVAADSGIEFTSPAGTSLRSAVDQPLPKPYRLGAGMKAALETAFRGQQLFEVGNPGLSLVTCRKGPGVYTLGLANNAWRPLPFKISSRCGPLESIRELPLDTSEKTAPGWLPEGIPASAPGAGSENVIAGGDIRIFVVRVREEGVREIPHVPPAPAPHGRFLPLRQAASLQREILARPGFFEHFDGVVVDWSCLAGREAAQWRQESAWIRRQGLRVMVDLSSGINLFPGLRLLDNLEPDYTRSLESVTALLDKMALVGARDLIFSLHRHPENNFTEEQCRQGFEKTLRRLAELARERQITLHLRLAAGKPPWGLAEAARWVDQIGAAHLRLAVSPALLGAEGPSPEITKLLAGKIGVWLLSSARKDWSGQTWDAHAPLGEAAPSAALRRWLPLAPDRPWLLDAVYASPDEECRDGRRLAELAATLERR